MTISYKFIWPVVRFFHRFQWILLVRIFSLCPYLISMYELLSSVRCISVNVASVRRSGTRASKITHTELHSNLHSETDRPYVVFPLASDKPRMEFGADY